MKAKELKLDKTLDFSSSQILCRSFAVNLQSLVQG